MSCYIQTGQKTCHDARGQAIPCAGTGQDAETARGISWPSPRFQTHGNETATDLLTGLTWLLDANPGEFPLDWRAARDFVDEMNREETAGFSDWRMPDRRELRSLISHQTRDPALPEGHPFQNIFLGWYWTSTTAAINPDFAWYLHLGGGRCFYAAKSQYYLLWPVRGKGNEAVDRSRPEPRFETVPGAPGAPADLTVLDRMTNLRWLRSANLTGQPVLWEEALTAVKELNETEPDGGTWRLPNINELESIAELSRHDPALPGGHPFGVIQEVYWSSTTSMYEPDWAWALYAHKGAIGVGQKGYARFHVWAVSDPR